MLLHSQPFYPQYENSLTIQCQLSAHTLLTGTGHLSTMKLEATTQHIFTLYSICHCYCLFKKKKKRNVPMSLKSNNNKSAWFGISVIVKVFWCSVVLCYAGNGPALNSLRKHEKSKTSFWVSAACLSCSYNLWNTWISYLSEKPRLITGCGAKSQTVVPSPAPSYELCTTLGKLFNPSGYWFPPL